MLAFPSVQVLDVTGPLQVFSIGQRARRRGGCPTRRGSIVARGPRVVDFVRPAAGDVPLPSIRAPLDTLVIAGGQGVGARPDDRRWSPGCASAPGRRDASPPSAPGLSCSRLRGARRAPRGHPLVVLCRAGPALPGPRVEADPIFVRDGPVWTSAGVTAGIDLALALVEEDLGRTAALAVARHLVVFLKRPGGQSQFSAALSLQGATTVRGAPRLDQPHLGDDISLPALAAQARMSERSLSRHYARRRRHARPRHRAAEGGSGAAALSETRRRSSGSRGAAASAPRRRCAAASCVPRGDAAGLPGPVRRVRGVRPCRGVRGPPGSSRARRRDARGCRRSGCAAGRSRAIRGSPFARHLGRFQARVEWVAPSTSTISLASTQANSTMNRSIGCCRRNFQPFRARFRRTRQSLASADVWVRRRLRAAGSICSPLGSGNPVADPVDDTEASLARA